MLESICCISYKSLHKNMQKHVKTCMQARTIQSNTKTYLKLLVVVAMNDHVALLGQLCSKFHEIQDTVFHSVRMELVVNMNDLVTRMITPVDHQHSPFLCEIFRYFYNRLCLLSTITANLYFTLLIINHFAVIKSLERFLFSNSY